MRIRYLSLYFKGSHADGLRLWERGSLFLAIYFSKGLGGEVMSSPAGYMLFMWEGHGKGRVGIDGCWQLLDKVYDVFITWFSGMECMGFYCRYFSLIS